MHHRPDRIIRTPNRYASGIINEPPTNRGASTTMHELVIVYAPTTSVPGSIYVAEEVTDVSHD